MLPRFQVSALFSGPYQYITTLASADIDFTSQIKIAGRDTHRVMKPRAGLIISLSGLSCRLIPRLMQRYIL